MELTINRKRITIFSGSALFNSVSNSNAMINIVVAGIKTIKVIVKVNFVAFSINLSLLPVDTVIL